jgi:outer membrane protein assembly factor BamB
VPDEVGTWQFKYTFPGTYIPAGQYWDLPGSETGGFMATGKFYTLYTSMWYKPSETEWQNLTVLPDMVSSWPHTPLPNEYWKRPVNVMWRDWAPSLGSYPFAGSVYYYPGGRTLYASNYKYTAYVTAPNSAHVVWKRTLPGALAGMVGGYTWDYSLSSSPGNPSIIYQGRCYQSVQKSFGNGTIGSIYQCYDLRTGEVFWERDLGSYPAPQYVEYYFPKATVGGAAGSLGHEADIGWQINFITISGSRLYRYNPANGAPSGNYSISPLSGGTYYMPGHAITVQNLGSSVPVEQRYRLINWTTYGTSANLTLYNSTGAITSTRIVSNISWPFSALSGGFGGCVDYEAGLSASCSWASPPGPQWCIGVEIIVTDLRTGQNLWTYRTNDTRSENAQSPSSFVMDRGKIAFGGHDRHWSCWDARTGRKLWTSEQTDYPWGAWWPYNTASYDISETKGVIITITYEGVYAIDWDTGKIVWHYTDENAVPFEGPYDATPFFTGIQSADGKIYAYNGEHTPSYPRDRGWSLYCINGTTGELIWKIKNPMVPGGIADGYMTAANGYDGYMYVFGRGKSATTVTASPKTIASGANVLIEGTLLDQSPAQPGTPCVSKDSMTAQMEYIHLQMPITGLWGNETLTGVPVTLTAIGSDGTVIDLGTVTTNGYYGTFARAWTPPKEDTYTIIASFAADHSYGSSNAATAVTVGPAPEPYPTIPEAQTPPDYTMWFGGILAAVVIAIVLALIGIFRKK